MAGIAEGILGLIVALCVMCSFSKVSQENAIHLTTDHTCTQHIVTDFAKGILRLVNPIVLRTLSAKVVTHMIGAMHRANST